MGTQREDLLDPIFEYPGPAHSLSRVIVNHVGIPRTQTLGSGQPHAGPTRERGDRRAQALTDTGGQVHGWHRDMQGPLDSGYPRMLREVWSPAAFASTEVSARMPNSPSPVSTCQRMSYAKTIRICTIYVT